MDVESHTIENEITLTPDVAQPTDVWAAQPVRRTLVAPAIEGTLWRRRLLALMGHVALVALDAAMVNVAFITSYFLRYRLLNGVRFTTEFIHEPLSSFRQLELLVTVGMLVLFWAKGLYHMRLAGTWFAQFWKILGAAVLAFALYAAYQYLGRKTTLDLQSLSRSLVLFAWVAIVVLVGLARLLVAGLVELVYRSGYGLTNLLVVGSGRLGKLMMQQIAASPHLGYRVVGFLHDQEGPLEDFGRFRVLGTPADLDQVLARYAVSEVLIALPSHQQHLIMHTMRHCERAGASYRLVPHLYELSLSRIEVETIQGIPVIGMKRALTDTLRFRVKRLVDLLGASLLLVFTAPIWLLTAMAITLDSPGPILLGQRRIGYGGTPFTCYKFRSMHEGAAEMDDHLRAHAPGSERGKFKLREDPRRTRTGAFIRRTSMDELPQLLNVLAGTMSLVGPRPPLPREYACYQEWEKARMQMPPGITGLWQVRGRSDLDFNEMVLMDLYYIEHWSLLLDVQILLRTIPAVLARRGAY